MQFSWAPACRGAHSVRQGRLGALLPRTRRRGLRFLRNRAAAVFAIVLGASYFAAAYFAAAYVAAAFAAGPDLRPAAATTVPRFVLPDLSGRIAALADQAGRIVIVHFFATWCEPCREELPALQRLAERAAPEVRILAVSVGEPDLRVRRFAETVTANFPILLDRDSAVARSWQVVSLPTTYVLDRDLRPSHLVESGYPWDALDHRKLFEQLADRDVRPTGPTNEPRGPKIDHREE